MKVYNENDRYKDKKKIKRENSLLGSCKEKTNPNRQREKIKILTIGPDSQRFLYGRSFP